MNDLVQVLTCLWIPLIPKMNLGRSKKTGIPPPYGIGDDQMMNMKEQPEFGLREVMILPDLAKNRTATGIILVILKITSLIYRTLCIDNKLHIIFLYLSLLNTQRVSKEIMKIQNLQQVYWRGKEKRGKI